MELKICYHSQGKPLVRPKTGKRLGRPPDVENRPETVLQASLTSVFIRFSLPCELRLKSCIYGKKCIFLEKKQLTHPT